MPLPLAAVFQPAKEYSVLTRLPVFEGGWGGRSARGGGGPGARTVTVAPVMYLPESTGTAPPVAPLTL